MRTAIPILLGTVAFVGCRRDPAPATPAATVSSSTPAPRPTGPIASSAGAPVDAPKPAAPAPDLTGKWCGAQVSEASRCKGKNVIYVELNTVLGAELSAAGYAIGGRLCEGYGHDCVALETGSFTGGTLILVGTITQPGSKKTDSFKGTFTLGADGVLVGAIVLTKAQAPVKTSLYRVE